MPTRIIDTHTHFYDPTRPQGVPWPDKRDPVLSRPVLPPEFRKLTTRYGRVETVVVEASPWLEDNQWLLDLAKASPQIIGVVGNLNPGEPGFPGHVKRFAKDPLYRGIRIGGNVIVERSQSAAFRDDIKRLADADLELDAHITADAFPALLHICDAVPGLRVVIDHLPFDDYGGMLKEVGSRRQIYAKVSYVLHMGTPKPVPTDLASHRAALEELCEVFGPDRVLYGSNWPVSNLVAPYHTIFGLVREFFAAKGSEAMERYFWKNALSAYRCVQRNMS
jgi:predicted TIM-barrel fold metal-dependent hydrolase